MNTLTTAEKTSRLLDSAVVHHPPLSRKGIQQRLFSLWFDGFVYNQIWEDPKVDLQALQLTPESRLLTISSGGCNALNYLIHDVDAIHAIDLNPNHLHLLRLKLAAMEHLPGYEDFFLFFGCADSPRNVENFYRYLAKKIAPDTREFWEKNVFPLGKRISFFERNFYHYSRLGTFLSFLHAFARFFGKNPEKVLQARDLKEQEAAYHEIVEPFLNNWFIRTFGKLPMALYSLGIPPQQFASMTEESRRNIIDIYTERVKRLVCNFPIQDNYFCWQAFGRKYDFINKKALPDYLKEDHFKQIKARLDRVYSAQTTLNEFLENQTSKSLDRFVLLDSQDWMTPKQIIELWRQIARVGVPGSRIIFRTAASISPLEKILPVPLMHQFTYMRQESINLFKQDRSAIYGGFHLYVLNN